MKTIQSDATGKLLKTVTKHGTSISKNINPFDFISELVKYKTEAEKGKTARANILADKEKTIAAINGQKEIILKYFELRFSERRDALGKFFDVLDDAISTKNDKELDIALTGIVGILKDNPLKDFDSFRKAMNEKQQIEI